MFISRLTRMALSIVGREAVVPTILAASLVGTLGAATPALAQNGNGNQPQVVVSDEFTVDLIVRDIELSEVLELLSMQTQRNIVVSSDVQARVTATLYGVTFYDALDAILNVNGFRWQENGNFIYVYTAEEFAEIEAAQRQRVVKVVRLDYLNSVDASLFVTPLLSEDGGQIVTNAATNPFTIPGETPVGADTYANDAMLVIFDFEENIAAIEELLKELDTKPVQILVEATILQTSLNEANAFGVDFSILGDLDFSDFMGGPLSAGSALLGGTDGITPADNQGAVVGSTPGNAGGPATFRIGVISDDISVFVRMLDQVTDTSIISNPKLLTMNRQPARVLVGSRIGYLSTTATDTATIQTIEFLDTGTQLYVRPFVSTDGNIRMELKPQVSEVVFRDTVDNGGTVITIPDEITQELVTNVSVRDGQTVVLGGLFRESTNLTRRQVPWLGDLPIVGAAFRGHEDNTTRSEVIFMITPSLITDALIESASDRAMNDIERLRTGARQGLLPWSREKMTNAHNVEAEQLARDGNYDMAMWHIANSLSLNPIQPDVLRLRQQITGMKETWPNRSLLNSYFSEEMHDRLKQIQPAPVPPREYRRDMHIDMPYEPVAKLPEPDYIVRETVKEPVGDAFAGNTGNAGNASTPTPVATVDAADSDLAFDEVFDEVFEEMFRMDDSPIDAPDMLDATTDASEPVSDASDAFEQASEPLAASGKSKIESTEPQPVPSEPVADAGESKIESTDSMPETDDEFADAGEANMDSNDSMPNESDAFADAGESNMDSNDSMPNESDAFADAGESNMDSNDSMPTESDAFADAGESNMDSEDSMPTESDAFADAGESKIESTENAVISDESFADASDESDMNDSEMDEMFAEAEKMFEEADFSSSQDFDGMFPGSAPMFSSKNSKASDDAQVQAQATETAVQETPMVESVDATEAPVVEQMNIETMSPVAPAAVAEAPAEFDATSDFDAMWEAATKGAEPGDLDIAQADPAPESSEVASSTPAPTPAPEAVEADTGSTLATTIPEKRTPALPVSSEEPVQTATAEPNEDDEPVQTADVPTDPD